MEWTDEGVVLSTRTHGESAAIISLLTRDHGRHAGLVRGGAGRRQRPILQPGNLISVTWRARLEDHLGAYSVEPVRAYAATIMDDAGRLAALMSACSIIATALPEREPHGDLYDNVLALLEILTHADDLSLWGASYIKWELAFLSAMGYGVDLSSCASTGDTDDLIYVSPKSGRAVSKAAGAPYKGKLLALPPFLQSLADPPPASASDLRDALTMTGYFLEHCLYAPHHKPIPEARAALVDRIG